ncbi:MAG: undecaprenyl-diphosphate phosphatase, partial [Eubacteriales bacterium]|nr:undecaprenyl-diphosphate phosphatase [Eubacteriales bacterium]
MSYIIELLRAAIYGIVQGVTEWLPVSSTGHMILLNSLVKSEALKNTDFFNLFLVVIQLGSIFAVIVLYFNKLFPLPIPKSKKKRFPTDFNKASTVGSLNKKRLSDAFKLWQKIFVGIIPVGIVGFIFDDIVEKYFYNN